MSERIAVQSRLVRFLVAAAATVTVNALLVAALASLNRMPSVDRRSPADTSPTLHVRRTETKVEKTSETKEPRKTPRRRFEVDLDRPTVDRPSPEPVRASTDVAPAMVGEIDVSVSDTAGAAGRGERQEPLRGDRVERPPRGVHTPPPRYPRPARRRQLEGAVTVKLLISRDGRVQQVRTQRVDGPRSFAEAVRQAVRNWRFRPAEHRGRKVPVWAVKTIRFKLERR